VAGAPGVIGALGVAGALGVVGMLGVAGALGLAAAPGCGRNGGALGFTAGGSGLTVVSGLAAGGVYGVKISWPWSGTGGPWGGLRGDRTGRSSSVPPPPPFGAAGFSDRKSTGSSSAGGDDLGPIRSSMLGSGARMPASGSAYSGMSGVLAAGREDAAGGITDAARGAGRSGGARRSANGSNGLGAAGAAFEGAASGVLDALRLTWSR